MMEVKVNTSTAVGLLVAVAVVLVVLEQTQYQYQLFQLVVQQQVLIQLGHQQLQLELVVHMLEEAAAQLLTQPQVGAAAVVPVMVHLVEELLQLQTLVLVVEAEVALEETEVLVLLL